MMFHGKLFYAVRVIGLLFILAGCSSESALPPGAVPLVQVMNQLPCPDVWKNFQQLTQVPRASHHEEKITAFMAAFGGSLGLETIVDSVGNVIIRKPATAGMENRPGVVLQAHLDLVAQKSPTSNHNFDTDPITAYVENGWVHANGTTLGADDGIGVAMIMTLLQAKDVPHGPLEALFTVNEEDGFTGVNGLAANVLRGKYFINVDTEEEGQFFISSAGGVYVDVNKVYPENDVPAGSTALQVVVDGLTGGHSGVDIGKGGGSAHQLMARLLVNAPSSLGVRLSSLAGGNMSNAIPRTTKVIVAVPSAQSAAFESYVKNFATTVSKELAATDPGLTVTVSSATLPAKVMDAAEQQALLNAVYTAPQGVYRMSSSVPGLVETSGNIGILNIATGKFSANIYVRSAIDAERDAEAQRFAAVFANAGAMVNTYGAYSSWPPNTASPLLALMTNVYTNLFSASPIAAAVHAGLETSVVGVKYPGLDMISIGPTLQKVHTVEERLEVATIPKVYALIVATLAQIK